MPRLAAGLLLVLVLLAGCGTHVVDTPSERVRGAGPSTTSTLSPTRITPACGTFGTGGLLPLGEVNGTVDSVAAARSALRSVVVTLSDVPHAPSDFEHVPRETVDDRGAVRDELGLESSTVTLYYFTPDGDARLDGMAVVTGRGGVFQAHIGDC